MQDPGGTIPGRTEIPFHIGIIGEHFTGIVEGDVKRIPQSGGDQFPFLALGIRFGDPSPVGFYGVVMTVGVLDEGEQVIQFAVRDIAVGIHLRDLGEIARQDVEGLPIGRQHHTVGAMLAGSLHGFQQGDLIELIVSVGVLEAVESAGTLHLIVAGMIHHHVETVERI